MAKTIEQKLVLSAPEGAKITRVKIADDGKNVEIIIATEAVQEQQSAVVNTENFDEVFPIIDPSELVGHKLLKHKPKNRRQERLLADIRKGIDLKLSAFRTPCMDPSEEDGKIVFKPGNKPAVGYTSVWWDKKWQKFNPEKNSRSGNRMERAAYLGTIIKYLIDEKNYSVAAAWEAVCDDSRDLGHYGNSKDAKNDFEPTGSRKVGAFFDLGNTFKIIRESEASGFLLAGGCYFLNSSYYFPLAALDAIYPYDDLHYSVGWLVLDV